MSLRRLASVAAALVALGLWLHAATAQLALADWPAWPFDPARMDLPQILLAYGLMPRGAVALLVGALLGLSGALMQMALRNPLASPATLGISAGAQLAIVAATVLAPGLLAGGRWPVALAGAAASATLTMGLGWRSGFAPVTMVVAGLLVGMTASAVSAAITIGQGEYLMSLVTWNGGSLVQQDWQTAGWLALVLGGGGGVAALLLRPLAAMGLGAAGAGALGVNVAVLRAGVLALAMALAASVTAAVGLVAFLGLAAPVLARALGARRPGALLLAAAGLGAVLLSVVDGLVLLLAQQSGERFPAGALTGLIGGPLLLWMLPRLPASGPPAGGAEGVPLRRRARQGRALALPALLVLLAAALALGLGRLPGGWVLLDADMAADLWPLRWPRLLAAGGAGGLLALSGALLQRITGNPMASPEVMGVTGGAGMGLALAVFLVPAPEPALRMAGAMGGAALALGLVLLAALRGMAAERLLLTGVALSALSGAVLGALMSVGDARSWEILAWLGGSAAGAGPRGAVGLAGAAVAATGLALVFRRWLTVLPLGAETAGALGLPVRGARLGLVLVAGLATGAATLLVGPMSFVGLMAPHIAARAGFARAAPQVAAAVLIGAGLMMLADFGARVASFPYEQPLGLFASLIGAPYLILLLTRRRR
ncbi:Fe(3+)-hydroxamate ABC transporter permease FhuB [Paroceanicella profunda]|uniref:Fe(3+)-hydroxamate ABC transporter permease FhuB n=1 Tax=Paroceanicella profunda TaxID=2579971 RepID=A0A5B8FXZ6_9RHOB|nr:Fe(3+)-hydroxamate ABC transporter permease FhuB [Paroceanicella profunda]QDL91469.1 Fe(3+)-hydroxamate ABC transporter permease FhuB [Paroceanicella profunda]